jgi:hypothetical protein
MLQPTATGVASVFRRWKLVVHVHVGRRDDGSLVKCSSVRAF